MREKITRLGRYAFGMPEVDGLADEPVSLPPDDQRRDAVPASWAPATIPGGAHQEGDLREPFHRGGLPQDLARRRFYATRSSPGRVRRLMGENGLLVPHRVRKGPDKAHDGSITTEAVDVLWGTDMTQTIALAEGVAHVLPAHRSDLIGGLPTLLSVRQPLSGWNRIAKWLVDKIFATIALVIFAPLMLVIVAAIRIESPGPILFRQKRYGFNIRPITVYKFRSMLHDPAGGRFRQATRNDSRVTQVGRFLRWTSLDELPQLFNVVNGTMSLVGPRPHAVELDEQFAALISGYKGRYRIKPGITGWAQVNGLRGETGTVEAMRARIEHDMYYIENWSLLLDLRILAMTALRGWVGPNAY